MSDYTIPIFNASTNASFIQMLTGSELILFCAVVKAMGYFIFVMIYFILALGSCDCDTDDIQILHAAIFSDFAIVYH